MFNDKSVQERSPAAMLLASGLAGATTDLHGLRYLGGEAVVAVLRGAAVGMRYVGCSIERCDTLVALTGDRADLLPILDHLDSSEELVRERSAWVLASVRTPAALAEPLARRLVDRHHQAVALPLAIVWLAARALQVHEREGFRAHLSLVRRIVDAPPGRRAALLAGIAPDLSVG